MAAPNARGARWLRVAGLSLALAAIVSGMGAASGFKIVLPEVRRWLGPRESQCRPPDCRKHLRQLAMGLIQYQQEYDDLLPPAVAWSDVTFPFIKNSQVFKCPAAQSLSNGYAFNQVLDGVPVDHIADPAGTVVVFDSRANRWNATDPLSSWSARHNGRATVAFADGSVRTFKSPPPPTPAPPTPAPIHTAQ